ncbi:MAG: guanylate kinase [Saprospiraceae bacterium]
MSSNETVGKCLIFTAPSGAGKTTLVRHLLETLPDALAFSVSATTRPARPGEVDGKDYHFLTADQFKSMIAAEEFAEWQEVYPGRWYGTLHSEIESIWRAGRHVIFDIEVKGASNLKKYYPDRSLAVFVDPPSREVLFDRLRGRDTEDEASLRARFARADEELAYRNRFDRVLVNDNLRQAKESAVGIARAWLGIGEDV